LLNLFVGPATAGIYVVAVQIVERLWMLSIGVNAVVFPQLAGHYKDQRTQSNLTPVAARWVLAVTGTAAFLLALVAYPLVHVLLGTDYRGAVLPLIVLSPGVAALSFSRVLSSDLAARGRVDLNLYLAAGALVVNLLANLLLIPGLGAFGAALATTLTYCADALARVFLFSRFSGLPWWQPILLRRSDWGLARTLLPSVLAATRRRSR
jgi:O-antigen/teichoic acid export membrane protein